MTAWRRVEGDIEEPEESKLFSAYPAIIKDEGVRAFICDTLRTAASSVVDPFDLDQMMELDMDVHHHDASQPVAALSTMADSLPGMGIVAAVLGVVITMGALGGPPEEIGHKVAAALVGTFLGILLCYGLVGPLAASMAKTADEERAYYHVLRVCDRVLRQGDAADHGGGDGAARHSGARPACLQRGREHLPQPAGTGRGRVMRGRIRWLKLAPSSSNETWVTAAITAAPGRWHTPISSRP